MKRAFLPIFLLTAIVASFYSGRASVILPGIITMTPESIIRVGATGKIELCRPDGTITAKDTNGSEFINLAIQGGSGPAMRVRN